MKLTSSQRRQVEEQLGVEALPEEHPAGENLIEAFGEHTFFLDSEGLHIIEPDLSPHGSTGSVIKLATWASDERTELLGHEPEELAITVGLEPEEPDPAA